MTEIIILTSPKNDTGFKLAGFKTETIGIDEVSAKLDKLSREGKYGLVCIEEKLFLSVKKEETERIRKKGLPVIMPLHIPENFGDSGPAEGHIAKLIRRTIGYQVKIKK